VSRVAPVLLALVLGLGLVGCTTTHVHIFVAYHYDETADCLESPAGADVIDGPDPGTCAAVRCWVSPGDDVYVTDDACDAPLGYVEQTSDMSGVCVKALAAYARDGHARCALADGGA
jgi:hypothetical protein